MEPNQLLRDIDRIRAIPGAIVQGRYDIICPLQTADELSRAWPEARHIVVADAGHVVSEPGIAKALREIADDFRHLR